MQIDTHPTPNRFQRFSDQPLKILTPDLTDRIRVANKARQALIEAGYQVVRQDLRARARPVLEVASVDAELKRLFVSARRITVNGRELMCGRFGAVDLHWALSISELH